MLAGEMEVMARALRPYVPDTKVRVDGRKGVVGDLDVCHCRGLEKRGFSAVGFACKR